MSDDTLTFALQTIMVLLCEYLTAITLITILLERHRQ